LPHQGQAAPRGQARAHLLRPARPRAAPRALLQGRRLAPQRARFRQVPPPQGREESPGAAPHLQGYPRPRAAARDPPRGAREVKWLFKTEPSDYSFERLVKEKKTTWTGVKNPLALKHLRQVKKGD